MEPLAYVHHPTWPLLEGRKPQHIFVTWRWGMGVGVWAPNFLKGQHRDSNPGHPACESGFVAITLRGPPPCCVVYLTPPNSVFLLPYKIRSSFLCAGREPRPWAEADPERHLPGGRPRRGTYDDHRDEMRRRLPGSECVQCLNSHVL